jgi:hypothetical protein
VPATPFTPDGANGHTCSMEYSTTDGSTPVSDPTLQITGNTMTADARHIDTPTTKSKTMQVGIVGNTIITPSTSFVSIKVNCSINQPVIPNLNTFIETSIQQTISAVSFSDPSGDCGTQISYELRNEAGT